MIYKSAKFVDKYLLKPIRVVELRVRVLVVAGPSCKLSVRALALPPFNECRGNPEQRCEMDIGNDMKLSELLGHCICFARSLFTENEIQHSKHLWHFQNVYMQAHGDSKVEYWLGP